MVAQRKKKAPELTLEGFLKLKGVSTWNQTPCCCCSFCDLRVRRAAFFLAIRVNSLLETNQRLRRTSVSNRLLTTSRLKRRSNCSCDSSDRRFTLGRVFTPFLV